MSNGPLERLSVRVSRALPALYHLMMEAETTLIAACRAIVAARLGDVVRVPAELCAAMTEIAG